MRLVEARARASFNGRIADSACDQAQARSTGARRATKGPLCQCSACLWAREQRPEEVRATVEVLSRRLSPERREAGCTFPARSSDFRTWTEHSVTSGELCERDPVSSSSSLAAHLGGDYSLADSKSLQ